MVEFRPDPPLAFTEDVKRELSRAFQEKSTLEPHSLCSVSGITDAEAVLLMVQLAGAALVELKVRVVDRATGLAIMDLAWGLRPTLPLQLTYRETPIERWSELGFNVVAVPVTEFEVR